MVDFLSGEEFDIKSITTVDTGLHPVEKVTGRPTMARAALSGVSSGALWSTFTGLMMSFALANQSAFFWVFFGTTGGALAGAFMSGPLYVMTGGHRDLTPQSRVVTSRYAIPASTGADQAFGLLQRSSNSQMCLHPACRRPELKRPSKYGSRPNERPRSGVRLSDEDEDGEAKAPRDNEHAVLAQESAETAVEPAEDSRKPPD